MRMILMGGALKLCRLDLCDFVKFTELFEFFLIFNLV